MSDFFSDALKNHKSGKISLAIEQYVKVLQSNTDHPDANHNLGNIYAKSRDARGIKLLENAVRLFPDREIYHVRAKARCSSCGQKTFEFRIVYCGASYDALIGAADTKMSGTV